MSKQTKKKLMPELRFPEFKYVGEWNNELLEKLYSFKVTNSYSRDQLNYENGLVKNIHYGDIHTKFSTLFNIEKEIVPFINPAESLEKIKSECYCVEGDMIFADASEDLEDVGKSIEIVHINNEKLLSGTHTLLARQKNKKLIIGFGGYLFKSNRIRVQIKKEAQGAKVLGISAGRLSNIEVAFPSDKKEQQKIADCLSSIDELVSAQTQKVEALKAHKKGLMQQLFPAEGETIPQLRFSEFLDAGEWNEIKLGQLGNLVQGLTYSPDDIRENGLLVLRSSNVQDGEIRLDDNVYVIPDIKGANLSKPNDILICVRNGSKSLIGKNALIPDGMPLSTHGAFMTVFRSPSAKFVFQLFQTSAYQRQVDGDLGATINSINGNNFIKYKFFVPSPAEQQKITDCLSSIDELITAQAQKVEALKAHKKGLMQQLFPTVDEVNG